MVKIYHNDGFQLRETSEQQQHKKAKTKSTEACMGNHECIKRIQQDNFE